MMFGILLGSVIITTLMFVFHSMKVNQETIEPAIINKKPYGYPLAFGFYMSSVAIGLFIVKILHL